jgi:hypothetical protein
MLDEEVIIFSDIVDSGAIAQSALVSYHCTG